MNTFCTICNRNYTSTFNYKRHIETVHPDGGVKRDVSEEDSDSETDSDNETKSENEESERSDSDESNENSDDGEDTNDFTHEDVRANVCFVLMPKTK